LLNQSSLPAKDIAVNVAFYKKVSDLSKELSATNDLLDQIESRIKNAELAIIDMPAPASDLLKGIYDIKKTIEPIKTKLNGDRTLGSREFETKSSINDRLYGIMYSVWNNTSDVPKTFMDDYNLAERQYREVYALIKNLDTQVGVIEAQLNKNKAPYTPGRWPDKK